MSLASLYATALSSQRDAQKALPISVEKPLDFVAVNFKAIVTEDGRLLMEGVMVLAGQTPALFGEWLVNTFGDGLVVLEQAK